MNYLKLMCILCVAAAFGLSAQVHGAAIGNPNVENGWSCWGSLSAVGNPSQANGWDTTSAVTLTANSERSDRPLINSINGNGLDAETGLWHDSAYMNSGFTNTYDDPTDPLEPRGGTVEGSFWLQYDLGAIHQLGEMWIWNDNQADWQSSGIKDVTIEYSTTGSTDPTDWTTIFAGEVPVNPRGNEPATITLPVDFDGASARYVVITCADPPNHNWDGFVWYPHPDPEGIKGIAIGEVRFNYPGQIKGISASSQHSSLLRKPENLLNGTGIDPDGFGNDYGGTLHGIDYNAMWLSGSIAESAANPNPGTVAGSHWVRVDFDQAYNMASMWIWNDHSADWAAFGMKEITVEYSALDNPINPGDWTTIYQGELPLRLPLYDVNTPLSPSLKIPFQGAAAKHIVITSAEDPNHNWITLLDPNDLWPQERPEDTEDVGLSEVRFFTVPTGCAEAIADGYGLPGDANNDCTVGFDDILLSVSDWLKCVEPDDPDCLKPW